jgi:tripartite-type tricarboxylate transporter receptor subunit TctC
MLAKAASVQWQGIAYKAIGNAWNDLYAGAIDFFFVDLTAARGQVVAGKARPLAITLAERSPLYPDVPAVAETYPGFVIRGFLAVAVPKAVPQDIKARLNELVNEAILSPAINKRLIEEFPLNPSRYDLDQCAAHDHGERAKWAEYVKVAKIEPQ